MTALLAGTAGPPTTLAAARPGGAEAALIELEGRTVAWFRIGPTTLAPESGEAEAEVVSRALELAGTLGVPVVGLIHSFAVDPRNFGAVAAWGRVAHRAVALSGVVPLVLVVTGPCHGGLAPLLGLADHVVFTGEASAFINGPMAVAAMSGLRPTAAELGGAGVHAGRSGLATEVVTDEDEALHAVADLLLHLPDNNLSVPAGRPSGDPVDRACQAAAGLVPADPKASYDVRRLLADVVDADSFHEVHGGTAANLVTGYAHLGGLPVAVIANQPSQRAGTLDIAASSKAARHVQGADSANLAILTVVDTPGFEPGCDLEWRGMIRHGAELVHAYAAATVPRVCVIVRKAYGGAYIVMDSKSIGSDVVFAWPGAQIAVMGAEGAVSILHRRAIGEASDPVAERSRLVADYEAQFCTPRLAAERGYVDEVIEPAATRAHVIAALGRLATKRASLEPARRHTNTPC